MTRLLFFSLILAAVSSVCFARQYSTICCTEQETSAAGPAIGPASNPH